MSCGLSPRWLATPASGVIVATHTAGFVILEALLTAVTFVQWFQTIPKAGVMVVAPVFLLVPLTAFVRDALEASATPMAFASLNWIRMSRSPTPCLMLSRMRTSLQRQHPKRRENQTYARPRKWVNSDS